MLLRITAGKITENIFSMLNISIRALVSLRLIHFADNNFLHSD